MIEQYKFVSQLYYKNYNFYKGFEGFCFQNCLKIILEYRGFAHPECYINSSLSLKYNNKLDKGIFSENDNIKNFLPRYSKNVIRYFYGKENPEKIFEENIEYIIKNDDPIIVAVDTYYLYYASNYKKNHAIHTLILCGYDSSTDRVFILDWYKPWFFKGTISKKDFIIARNSENIYDGSIYSGCPIQNNWTKILKFEPCKDTDILLNDNLCLTIKQYCMKSDFELIGIDALEKINEYLSINRDKSDYLILYDQLYRLNQRKKLFLQFLLLFKKYKDNSTMNSVTMKLKIIIQKWEVILMLMIKFNIIHKESLEMKILDKIKQVILYEKELIRLIINLYDCLN